MATSQSGAGSKSKPATVTMDADLVAQLARALEMIGTAFTVDELNNSQALALIGRLAQRTDGGRAADTADPARVRAARDYDVIRGLLGQAGAPRPLRMRRTGYGLDVVDPVPVAAAGAEVESSGDAKSGHLTEHVDLDRSTAGPLQLPLHQIGVKMPISRVELFDQAGTLVAFGPSLPPVQSIRSTF